MDKISKLLDTAESFCLAWFEKRDLAEAVRFLSENVSFVGTGEGEKAFGINEVQEYIRQDMKESSTPFELEFTARQANLITQDAGMAILEFDMINSEYRWHVHSSLTIAVSEERCTICHIHFAIPTVQQKPGEHYPLTLVRKHIDDARHELLSSSIAGGLMGGYLEENFPFYYINDRMLKHLGYASEEEFVEDIGGYVSNCMHPDDRSLVDDSVSRQLAENDEYTVEYRMRKKNGSYIYVHDIGRVIIAEDGRKAILSVCTDVSEQYFEKQQGESLIKAMNGGTMICRISGKKYIPLYMSTGLGSITGYTKEELKDLITEDPMSMVYPPDKDKLCAALERVLQGQESTEETYRTIHRDGHYVWVTGIYQKIGEEEGDPLMRCIFTLLSKQFELQNNILDGADIGICVIDSGTFELCLANEAIYTIKGRTFSDYTGKKCYEVFEEIEHPCDNCILHTNIEKPEEIYIPRLDKTITMTKKESRWMGRDVVIEYLSDITAQKKAREELRLGEERLAAAIRHAGIQFWEYDIIHNRAYMSEILQQSYHVPQIIENFPESFIELGILHPDDEEAYRTLHRRLQKGEKDAMLEYRMRKPGEGYCWQLAHYTNSFDEEGHPVRAFATAEYIDRYKELEEQFSIAARLTGVRVWTLDMQNYSMFFNENDARDLQVPRTVTCRTPEELREADILHPEDVEMAWEKSYELTKGSNNISFNVRLKVNENYRWARVSYTVMKSMGGTPVKAIGSSIDIHEHVMLEQRFKQELEYSAGLEEPSLINKAQCNITKGIVTSYLSAVNTAVTTVGASYEDAVDCLAMAAVEREKREELRRILKASNIIDAYSRGENYYTLDYQRKASDGTLFWASTTVRVYQNPDTGDIMIFMYTYNIEDKKTAEIIVDRVVDTNFEYLILFNTVTGKVEKTIDKSGTFGPAIEGQQYEDVVIEALSGEILPEEREEYLPLFYIKNVSDKLDRNGSYSISSDILDHDSEELRHKLWGFNWFDKHHIKILSYRSDITEAYRQEQHQKEALSAALTAAKQANVAKSDFLSRMSHEIRTPMNAIIGMTAIAARSIGNDEQVTDCISKIGISSRFLLSLINDILDMSRIESGKMLLKKEKIPFTEFITGVNTICHTQAAAKDVEYECIVDPVVDDYYIGDAMKLQQVLVNILGNAVKFTSSGGKVTFAVSQRNKTKNDASLRFVISDTGIGMGEEFLPHLFEPFEQESMGITSGYGGTGLGLAISKNIVDLMDGKIQVRSIKDLGTEFTVDVKLGITEEEKQRSKKQHAHNFSHLKTLVVDDDITVCESAVLTLKEIGITAEWVDSGRRAVNRVQEKWDKCQYYDMILIDWKMPEMDGIETSRRIREIVGPDVTIIIMTAYDWSAIEKEAKAVGVNMLMSKPMFKSTLISAFSKALDQKEEEQEEIPVEEYDFKGRRLLLVEDQPLNAEIAQMILEDVGFQVETAENGLRAIEMFSKSEEGYYDAILMDIRMPIMDGLQASMNIRHLSNKDAKSIPIIAMTADAFDEDADKSKAAGMNMHLAKPIDPPKLYRTLYNFIYGRDTEEEL